MVDLVEMPPGASDGQTEKKEIPMTPLPRAQVNCVILVQTCEALQINILFPFVAFMVEDFGYSGEQLGYYSGFLAASFCFAQFFSCVPWGLFSDKFGRKPAIIFGTLGGAVGMLVFGTAKSYNQAMLGRMLSGFLCGNVGILKSLLTEITDDSNRGKGFAYMSIAWALGCIIAPISGGLLCKPAEKYPSYFSDSGIFAQHPYLLPCLMVATCNVLAATACVFFLKESRNFHHNRNTMAPPVISDGIGDKTNGSERKGIIELARLKALVSPNKRDEAQGKEKAAAAVEEARRGDYSTVSTTSSHGQAFSITDDDEDEDEESLESSRRRESEEIGRYKKGSPLSVVDGEDRITEEGGSTSKLDKDRGDIDNDSDDDEEEDDEDEDEEICCLPIVNCFQSCFFKDNDNNDLIDATTNNTLHTAKAKNKGMNTEKNREKAKSKNKKRHSVLLQKTVLTTAFNYGLLAMSYILLDETMPLFLKYDVAKGGFSYDTDDIGLLLSVSGLAMFLFNMYFLPNIAAASKRKLFAIGSVCGIPCALLFPFLSIINAHLPPAHRKPIMFTALCLNMVLKSVFATLCFLAVMIQLNHSVHSQHLGIVNGLGQSFAALMRAIGPALGGLLWSLCVEENFIFFNFMAVSFLFVGNLLINKQLPASLDFKKEQKKRSYAKDTVKVVTTEP